MKILRPAPLCRVRRRELLRYIIMIYFFYVFTLPKHTIVVRSKIVYNNSIIFFLYLRFVTYYPTAITAAVILLSCIFRMSIFALVI